MQEKFKVVNIEEEFCEHLNAEGIIKKGQIIKPTIPSGECEYKDKEGSAGCFGQKLTNYNKCHGAYNNACINLLLAGEVISKAS